MWRLIYFIPIWAVYMVLIKLPIAISGMFVTPFLWKYRNMKHSDVLAQHPWTTPWLNPEDWYGTVHHYKNSLPKWWAISRGINFWSFWKYHAIRNPGNGLRNIEWLDLDIVPEKVKFKRNLAIDTFEPKILRRLWADGIINKKTAWYLAWQGWQGGCKIVHIWTAERHLVIKVGWRIEPSFASDRIIPEVLTEDASFASKFLFYRKG